MVQGGLSGGRVGICLGGGAVSSPGNFGSPRDDDFEEVHGELRDGEDGIPAVSGR